MVEIIVVRKMFSGDHECRDFVQLFTFVPKVKVYYRYHFVSTAY